jgi:hypothetical protein
VQRTDPELAYNVIEHDLREVGLKSATDLNLSIGLFLDTYYKDGELGTLTNLDIFENPLFDV